MEQEIISGLLARGVPLHIAQGMVANMKAESNLQPGINEIAPLVPGSRGGFGLNQWTGPRRRAFESFAASRNAPLDDLNTQLDFTLAELQGPERNAWEALQGARDPLEAARIYSDKFLRPGIPRMEKRLAYAADLAGMPAPAPGQLTMSSQGGAPMRGLLDMGQRPEQEASGLVGLLTGEQKPWASKLNDIGAVLLALSGSPAAAPLLEMTQQRRADRKEDARQNRTLEWLQGMGTPQALQALQYAQATGDVAGAAKMAMQQPDPLDAIRLETAQIQLAQLKSGAENDPNVQSSAMLPDQSGVVMTLRDGTVQVRTVGGDMLSGDAAMDFVRTAQENAANVQRSIYGARREGTLGADIGMGEEAAAAGARGTELGRAQGAAIAGAPVDVATADTTLGLIEQVRNDPGLEIGTGATSFANRIPGTPGYDFQNRVDQLLSGGFLTAIDQLRGMGALSNAEGQTATRAISRMDTATSKDAFLDALSDYEAVVKMGRERAERRIRQPEAAPTGAIDGVAPPAGMPSDDDLLRMYGG